jgi:hypothetical protein
MDKKNSVGKNVAAFRERYRVDFKDENTIESVSAEDLLFALKRIAEDLKVPLGISLADELAEMLAKNPGVFRLAGFEIKINPPKSSGMVLYHITKFD